MLDAAIVGGGLSGLALATLLRSKGVDYGVFEARSRLGGRALTVKEPPRLVKDGTGLAKESPRLALDLGPTWFWPADNPQLLRLLGVLGVATFEQHESGWLVLAPTAQRPAKRVPSSPVYASARRLVGGAQAIIDALAARVGPERVRLGHELLRVVERAGYVELSFRAAGVVTRVEARKVVLALPPRLVHEGVEFSPPLGPELARALAETPTWMASHAKALVPFPGAFWRARGDSGAALAAYPGAVLAEVFDACDSNQQAALGGFFALGPAERRARQDELPQLVLGQLSELFGPLPDDVPEPLIQDWATERWTAAALDLERPAQAPTSTPAIAREPHWNARLLFGGAETGGHHPGHMEGALEAALR
jgi:monoamine oxidase